MDDGTLVGTWDSEECRMCLSRTSFGACPCADGGAIPKWAWGSRPAHLDSTSHLRSPRKCMPGCADSFGPRVTCSFTLEQCSKFVVVVVVRLRFATKRFQRGVASF